LAVDDDVSDHFRLHMMLEERAAEVAAALKVVADFGLSDERWPLACADVLCTLIRADECAVSMHTLGGSRAEGRGARRLLGDRAAAYSSSASLPAAGIHVGAERGVPRADVPATVVRVTVLDGPEQRMSFFLFFDRAIGTEEMRRARMLLEIAEPVLASSASIRAQLAQRVAFTGRAMLSPALATSDAIRLVDRYGLTRRELEVTQLLLRGESNREIADRLSISEHTARHHTGRVLDKLGVKSRAAIARAVSPQRKSGPFRAM